MSRLADRIRAQGCRPVTAGDLYRNSPDMPETQESLAPGDPARGRRLALEILADARQHPAPERFDRHRIDDDVSVILANGAASYMAALDEVSLTDLVSTVAPPFKRFLVEFVGSFAMDRNRAGCSDRFEPWVLAPPHLNGPGRMLEFRIASFDDVSNPRDMAERLVGVLDRFSAERVLMTVSASPGAN